MLNRLRKETEGFTIIEVMIVLAIAGLIILIVLLAVPALQRNSRNTTMKSDVGTVIGAVNEFASTYNGNIPQTIGGTGTITLARTVAPIASTTATISGSTTVSSTPTWNATAIPADGTFVVYIGRKCDGSSNTRAVAVAYPVETTGASTRVCQEG